MTTLQGSVASTWMAIKHTNSSVGTILFINTSLLSLSNVKPLELQARHGLLSGHLNLGHGGVSRASLKILSTAAAIEAEGSTRIQRKSASVSKGRMRMVRSWNQLACRAR